MITRKFLSLSSDYLRNTVRTELSEWSPQGDLLPRLRCWCAWTSFSRLRGNAGYWTEELPLESELAEENVKDGGTWGQPFWYHDIAHIVIPRTFYEEGYDSQRRFYMWDHYQDIDGLAALLTGEGIEHRLGEYALEIKLY